MAENCSKSSSRLLKIHQKSKKFSGGFAPGPRWGDAPPQTPCRSSLGAASRHLGHRVSGLKCGLRPHHPSKKSVLGPPLLLTATQLTVTPTTPVLYHSWTAHGECITEVEVCIRDDRVVIVSASSDCSLKLWTATGTCIGTFGQVNNQ